jgi:transposase
VLKTDLKAEQASKEVVRDRYRDLALVEQAFRTSKTVQLEMRPIHVRREVSTRGHALVVMLAYRLVQELARAVARGGPHGSGGTPEAEQPLRY